MKRALICTAALLAALCAAPAMADETAPPTAEPALSVPGAAPAPILAQNGPPDQFPSRGNACRIPPPFQPESCVCPLVFEPVCGCNGVTYTNACFARCEVRFFTEGACGSGGEI